MEGVTTCLMLLGAAMVWAIIVKCCLMGCPVAQNSIPERFMYYDGRSHQWMGFPVPIRMESDARSPHWKDLTTCQLYLHRYASVVYALVAQQYPDEMAIHRAIREWTRTWPTTWATYWLEWCSDQPLPVPSNSTDWNAFLVHIGAYDSLNATCTLQQWIRQQLEVSEWQKRVPGHPHPLFGRLDPTFALVKCRIPAAQLRAYSTARVASHVPSAAAFPFSPTKTPLHLYWNETTTRWVWLVGAELSQPSRALIALDTFLQDRPTKPVDVCTTTTDPVVYCMSQAVHVRLWATLPPFDVISLATRA
jgi:hypothetical protein